MEENLLKQFVESRKWYQHFDFLEGYTTGQMDCVEKWRRLQLPADFEGKSVLDLGCNSGWYCFEAKRRGAGYVLGVDLSLSNILAAKTIRDKIYRMLDIDFRVADIEKLELSEKFDTVLLLATLHRLGSTPPPLVASLDKQLEFLNRAVNWVKDTFVLEYYYMGDIHQNFLTEKFKSVQSLGLSISPDSEERRIIKCVKPL